MLPITVKIPVEKRKEKGERRKEKGQRTKDKEKRQRKLH
jgi:hypothetical protein